MDEKEKLEVTVLEKNAIVLFNDELVKTDEPLEKIFNSMKEAFPNLKFVAIPHSIISGISTFNIKEGEKTVIQVRSDNITKVEKRAIIKHLKNVYPGVEIVFTNNNTELIAKSK